MEWEEDVHLSDERMKLIYAIGRDLFSNFAKQHQIHKGIRPT